MTEVEVIIVGAGPTGLTLACELRQAGARVVVLERRAQLDDTPKAAGFNGQILSLLRYRGALERFEAACGRPAHPATHAPFGGVRLDLDALADPPLHVLGLSQPRLERLLDAHARELGAVVRRGHEVLEVTQTATNVTVDVCGPDGRYRLSGRHLVGCDGPRSTIREQSGIRFPGITYPEINRLGQAVLHESVTRHENGDLDVAGLGRVAAGTTHTERGAFALGWLSSGVLMIQTTEAHPAGDEPMGVAEFQSSIHRVLGAELPLGEVTRLSRYGFEARQADHYRAGRILVAGDAAHQFPATGVGINAGMLDAVNLAWKLAAHTHGWAPPGLLDTYHAERHHAGTRVMLHTQAQVALRRGQDPAAAALRDLFAEVMSDEQPRRRLGALIAGADTRCPMAGTDQHELTARFAPDLTVRSGSGATSLAHLIHTSRPLLVALADRPELHDALRPWRDRVDLHALSVARRPADALLIRPDGYIAWAGPIDAPGGAAPGLRDALGAWFGQPADT